MKERSERRCDEKIKGGPFDEERESDWICVNSYCREQKNTNSHMLGAGDTRFFLQDRSEERYGDVREGEGRLRREEDRLRRSRKTSDADFCHLSRTQRDALFCAHATGAAGGRGGEARVEEK